MTGHTTTYIFERMPYAQGLQFVTCWYQKNGTECRRPSQNAAKAFDAIAG